jgi:hypothetical protein
MPRQRVPRVPFSASSQNRASLFTLNLRPEISRKDAKSQRFLAPLRLCAKTASLFSLLKAGRRILSVGLDRPCGSRLESRLAHGACTLREIRAYFFRDGFSAFSELLPLLLI